MQAHARLAVIALIASAGSASAQSVEFRIVQESATANNVVVAAPPAMGTFLTSASPSGNYAVQARVTAGANGSALGGFSFDIVIPGEADANGTLAKLRISAADGTYYSGAAVTNATVGAGGIARTYSYLAGISASFNGLINTSSGTFTNQPTQQEIGLVTGSATGSALLATPTFDPSNEGNPATWSGYGVGATPPSGATAPIDPVLGPQYFAQGQFIDIYRFRYTVSNFTGRQFTITVANASAQVFNQFVFNNGAWGPQATTVAAGNITTTGLMTGTAFPAPTSAALLGLGAVVASRRRRVA
jgi:hypothetical protein